MPNVQSALPSANSLMVQVAAVKNDEDATVLTNALRRRGYPVISHRDPADGLIHVRIGPFPTREEANQWRMKLLNDGYNAIVQP
jgi:cell division septation protein DedD